jgi:hypothetical protein
MNCIITAPRRPAVLPTLHLWPLFDIAAPDDLKLLEDAWVLRQTAADHCAL